MWWQEFFKPWILGPFLMVWFVVVLLVLRFSAGVTRSLKFDPGVAVRTSSPGYCTLNGVHSGLGFQIVEYPQGWMICMLPTWFFGVIWFPKERTIVGEVEPATWFLRRRRVLKCDDNTVLLINNLADFVTVAAEAKMEPSPEFKKI